jgi:hypothetical protein
MAREAPAGFRDLTDLLVGGEAVDPGAVPACPTSTAPPRAPPSRRPGPSPRYLGGRRTCRSAGRSPIPAPTCSIALCDRCPPG